MIDRKWIGHELPASVLPIPSARAWQYFAKVIGETTLSTRRGGSPAVGYPDLPCAADVPFLAEMARQQ